MDYTEDEDLAPEDVLNALLVRLLDPLLHNLNPAAKALYKEDDIAYQMEALAWLYNHYLRQSFPHLPFLDSPTLCRKAVIQRANLAGYLSLQNGEQTLTELRVTEACDAAGSQSSPKAKEKGRRVSRVAALVLSPCRKQCILVQSLVTKSIWSLIEEDVDNGRKARHEEARRNESSAETVKRKGKAANSKKIASVDDNLTDSEVRKLILSAVEGQTGIDAAALQLENDYFEAQCMSQGIASTHLYILVSSRLFDIKAASYLEKAAWVDIDEVLSRAAGPLVEASEWGVYPASAIDYFHLRPFCAFLQNKMKHNDKKLVESPCPPNGIPTKLQNPTATELDSRNKHAEAKGKNAYEDPTHTVIILEDQDKDDTEKKESPRSCIARRLRKDLSQTISTFNGSNKTVSLNDELVGSRAKIQDHNNRGRKKSQKTVETQSFVKESPSKIVPVVASSNGCKQDGGQDFQRVDNKLEDRNPDHATNPCKGRPESKTTSEKVEQAVTSSVEDTPDCLMKNNVVENNKDEQKASPGSKPLGASAQEVSYIRPKMQGRSSLRASGSLAKKIEKKSEECETQGHKNGQIVTDEIGMTQKTIGTSVQEEHSGTLLKTAMTDLLEVGSRGDKTAAIVNRREILNQSQGMDAVQHCKDNLQSLKERRSQFLRRLLDLTAEYQSQSEALLRQIAEHDERIHSVLQGNL